MLLRRVSNWIYRDSQGKSVRIFSPFNAGIPLWIFLVFLLGLGFLETGCSSRVCYLVSVKNPPEIAPQNLDAFRKIQPSAPLRRTLAVNALNQKKISNLDRLIQLQNKINEEPTLDLLAAFAELGYDEGILQEKENLSLAAEIQVAVILNSYRYLFDPQFEQKRNPYNPEYVKTAQLYNRSSERLLRMIKDSSENGLPRPGSKDLTLTFGENSWKIRSLLTATTWTEEEIGDLQFVSDYEVKGKVPERRKEGLGVPMIVTRCKGERPEELYYPPELSFPMTLLIRPNPRANALQNLSGSLSEEPQLLLEFYDPLTAPAAQIAGKNVPLAADFTTPLAYNFRDPRVNKLGTLGLVRPEFFFQPLPESDWDRSLAGLYAMGPYDPQKIPVIMIHGLWSSPMTWMAMISELQSQPEFCENYQIWVWFYPTGLPWWASAVHLRSDLEEMRKCLDPERKEPRLDEMVLIGHSMGGLIARLQVCDSGDELWRVIQSDPQLPDDLKESETIRQAATFTPNPSIRRVITIATPFEGSDSVNPMTEWLAGKMISPPEYVNEFSNLLLKTPKQKKAEKSLLNVTNSVESLSPNSSFFRMMDQFRMPENVAFNNIIGMKETGGFLIRKVEGDGVVDYKSSHREDVESELAVESYHMEVHTDPASIQETKRILREHLLQMNQEEAYFSQATASQVPSSQIQPFPAPPSETLFSPVQANQKFSHRVSNKTVYFR